MTSLAWLPALPTTESANLLGRRPLSRRLARAHSKSSEYSLLWREGAVLQNIIAQRRELDVATEAIERAFEAALAHCVLELLP
jgi:chorismate mutase